MWFSCFIHVQMPLFWYVILTKILQIILFTCLVSKALARFRICFYLNCDGFRDVKSQYFSVLTTREKNNVRGVSKTKMCRQRCVCFRLHFMAWALAYALNVHFGRWIQRNDRSIKKRMLLKIVSERLTKRKQKKRDRQTYPKMRECVPQERVATKYD